MTGQLALYRGCTPVVDTAYDTASSHSPVEAVIDAVATAAEVDPTELPPLYEAIDPDALNQLFENATDPGETEAVLSFRVDTWNIFIRGDGRIRVCDATRPTDPRPIFESVTG